MANRKDRTSGVTGPGRTERPRKPRDVVGELLDIDDLKKIIGGTPGCKECLLCRSSD